MTETRAEDTPIEVRKVPEPIDNDTLQRLVNEDLRYLHENPGADSTLELSLYIISDFDFSGLDLRGIHAQNTTFHRCRFVGTDFYGADFGGTKAPNADFRGAVLAKAEFYEADLSGANFDGANLIRTNFMDCDLRGATFRNADFSGGLVSDCNTEGATFGPGYVQIIQTSFSQGRKLVTDTMAEKTPAKDTG